MTFNFIHNGINVSLARPLKTEKESNDEIDGDGGIEDFIYSENEISYRSKPRFRWLRWIKIREGRWSSWTVLQIETF